MNDRIIRVQVKILPIVLMGKYNTITTTPSNVRKPNLRTWERFVNDIVATSMYIDSDPQNTSQNLNNCFHTVVTFAEQQYDIFYNQQFMYYQLEL